MPALADSMFILADDLSGAADCAVRAATAGLSSVVLFDADTHARADVVAVDADTRELPASRARAINAAQWASRARPRRLFYKKIDSTLRGHFAEEMSALTDAGVAVVAPAFPAAGRTTREARVLVRGVPLEDTETWVGAGMTGEADVVAMLRGQGLEAQCVPLQAVRGDLRGELSRRVADGRIQALVCDAEIDEDLRAIAAASVGLPVYWVGSAGLAAHLPAAAGIEAHAPLPVVDVVGPALFVIGSFSSVSRGQAQALEEHAGPACFVAAPAMLQAGEASASWRAMRDAVRDALADGRDAVVRIGTQAGVLPGQGRALCTSLAALLAPAAPRVGALVATGGETARAVLGAFGVHGLRVVREIEPGVPLSMALAACANRFGSGLRPIPVVTKAGAFGSNDALLNVHREIAGLRRRGQAA